MCNVLGGRGIRDDVRPVSGAIGEELALSSFAEFYESERLRAIRLAWLLTHDSAVAEDVVQDAFTALFHRFSEVDQPAAYLRRSIINGVNERGRRTGREARRLALVTSAAPVEVDGPTGGLVDAIANLSLPQRTVVVLRYWADLDHAAIADAMGVRVGTVRSLLSRATAQLRKEIEP
jgi:DNA-directed RNA polymerase specialized sigma24 family protein